MDLKTILDHIKRNWIASSITAIVLGLILLLFPDAALRAVCYVVGGVAIAFGVIRTVQYFREDHTYPFFFQSGLIAGLFTLGLGLFMVTNARTVMGLVPMIFGVLLIGCGVGNILRAVDAKGAGVSYWGILLLLAIITVALGWVILANPFGTLRVAIMVIGAGLIYEGVTDLLTAMFVGKKIEKWKKQA